jgi:hypothetical protein
MRTLGACQAEYFACNVAPILVLPIGGIALGQAVVAIAQLAEGKTVLIYKIRDGQILPKISKW